MGIMWWYQRKAYLDERTERMRLQRVIEGFLPTAHSLARSNRALSKVIGGDNGDDV